jgi:menaquinone-specific isochorismate synthase
VAFGSFTFDPSAKGSVVVVPDSVSESPETLNTPNHQIGINATLQSDGTKAWREGLDKALRSLSRGAVEKVVLTRQVSVRLDAEPSINAIASALRLNQTDCYVFAVDGLVGASPELLVSHRDGVISSLVLAGTAPNAESLGSAKMDLEHVLAASSVRDGLSQFVTALATPSRTVLEFGEIKHLATRFEGRATNGSTVLDVLGTLHPTASVAGTPRAAALDLIREIEPTSRGRYAGPVGWFNTAGEGEFAIALRCGLIEENQVTLYSGGGLVQGSEPTSEFAETELKLRPMLQALGVQ